MSVISAEFNKKNMNEVLLSLIESFSDSIALFDANNRLLFCNSHYLKDNEQLGGIIVPGVSVEEICRVAIEKGILDSGEESTEQWIDTRLKQAQLNHAQYKTSLSGGRTVLVTQRRLGEYMLEIHTDISDLANTQQALDQEQLLLRTVIDSMTDSIFVKDLNSKFVLVNRTLCEYLGVESPKDIMGKSYADFFDGELSSTLQIEDSKVLQEGHSIEDVERKYVLKNRSEPQWHSVSKVPLRNTNSEIVGVVCQSKDITERHEFTRELSYKATHDSLTELINRGEFERQLKQYFVEPTDHISGSVLCYLDLDKFKNVNDTAGHAAGDELLVLIAAQISRQLRSTDLVARLGGDEFAVLMRDSGMDCAFKAITRLIQKIAEISFVWRDQKFKVSASAGLTAIDRNLYSISETCSHADLACYRAKNLGRNRVCVYAATSDSIPSQ